MAEAKEEERTMRVYGVPPMVTRTFTAPPGKLGIVVDTTEDGPKVDEVGRYSALKGMLYPGEVVIGINDVNTRSMSAKRLSEVLAETSGAEVRIGRPPQQGRIGQSQQLGQQQQQQPQQRDEEKDEEDDSTGDDVSDDDEVPFLPRSRTTRASMRHAEEQECLARRRTEQQCGSGIIERFFAGRRPQSRRLVHQVRRSRRRLVRYVRRNG
jgi:hypothetical protein